MVLGISSKSLLRLLVVLGITVLSFLTHNAKAISVSDPSWWNGNCNVNNHGGSAPLGTSYTGVKACGPGPMYQGGYDYLVRYASGMWGEYEWECVELSMRYMYQVYGIEPYNAPGGKDVYENYPVANTKLLKQANDGSTLPSAGDVVSMGGTLSNKYGHTAIITAVNVNSSGTGTVTILEQNGLADSNGSRDISVTNKVLGDGVTGWLHDPNYTTYTAHKLTQIEKPASGPWASYDISNASHPTSYTPGTLWGSSAVDNFVVGADGSLKQYHATAGQPGWTVYTVLPASMHFTGGVHNATTSSTVELFVTDESNKLIQIEKTSAGSWTYADISTGAQVKGKPAVIWGSTGVDVFSVGKDGSLKQHHTNFGQGTWSVYTVLPASNNFEGGIDAVLSGSNVEIFLTDTAHRMLQVEKTPSGPWSKYDISTGNEVAHAPGVIWGTAGVDVYANGNDGSLKQFHTAFGQGTWNVYTVQPASLKLAGGVDALQNGTTIEIFGERE